MSSNTNACLVLHETVRVLSLMMGLVGAYNFQSDAETCMTEKGKR